MQFHLTNLSELDLNGHYTYADYVTWQFEEMVELIKGKVFKMSPAPTRYHQRVSHNLNGLLYGVTRGKLCQAYSAPTDVRFITKGSEDKDITTVVQPDLFIVCDPSKLDSNGCLGSPDFIVEIISPATATKDLKIKFELYQQAGVGEYWVVYPGEQVIHVFLLINGKYVPSGVYTEHGPIPLQTLTGISLELQDIFEP